jgi:Ca2+-transporting ATPase
MPSRAQLDPSAPETAYAVPDACSREVPDVLACLGTTPDGLTPEEAARRLAEIGPNELPEGEKHTLLSMIVGQFTDFLILLLIGAAIISGPLLREWADTIAIVVIVLLNAVIGVFQEYRA